MSRRSTIMRACAKIEKFRLTFWFQYFLRFLEITLSPRHVLPCTITRRIALFIATVMVGCMSLVVQRGGGIITCTAIDSAAAVIAETDIVVTDVNTDGRTPLNTNNAGSYTTPSLPLGTFSLRIEVSGFQPLERSGVVRQVDSQLSVRCSCNAAAMAELNRRSIPVGI